jgi:hypothetical protein
VTGGSSGIASGEFSTVLGGESNAASGIMSLAAGTSAIADRNGCAVFAFWGLIPTPMTCGDMVDVVRIGAANGLSVDYDTQVQPDGYGSRWVAIGKFIANQTISTWTGAYLSDGGVWINNSDRDSKTQLRAVDTASVLSKVAALPISTWRYKSENGQRHLGPMAQDFHAAFGLGADERHIATIDEDGVALAAIQGMYRQLVSDKAALESRLESQHQQIESQHQQIEWQGRQIEELEDRISLMHSN